MSRLARWSTNIVVQAFEAGLTVINDHPSESAMLQISGECAVTRILRSHGGKQSMTKRLSLDDGEVRDGIDTCPHHEFWYDLTSGGCLTAPEVLLQADAVRVIGTRIEVGFSR
ncbi:MAG: hypothetical protein ABSC06_13440 [Rhodopila sp.]